MKFTNGFWVTKDAISANYAVQVYEAEEKDGSLIVYAPAGRLKRAATPLVCPCLRLSIHLRVIMFCGLQCRILKALLKGPFSM